LASRRWRRRRSPSKWASARAISTTTTIRRKRSSRISAEFQREIETTLAAPEARLPNAEDCWLFLHLVFETIWKYRFICRDINHPVARYHVIEAQFRRILAHKIRVAEQILAGLPTLAQNIVLAASYWMSFAFACDSRATQDDKTLARGAFHVIALSAPYLEPRERELFDQLAKRYIA